MQRLSLFVSLVAAALAGVCAWAVTQRPAPRPDVDLAAFESRLASLERVLGDRAPEAAPRPATDGPAAAHTEAVPAAGPGTPTLAGTAPRAAVTLPDLERRLVELEKTARERAAAPTGAGGEIALAKEGVQIANEMTMPTFYSTVDDAAKDLALTPAQKADFERIVADAKRDADALRKIPDEEGKTWEAVQKDAFKMDNGVFAFNPDALSSFREKVIPGRNESYGAADRRIKADAKRRLHDTMTADQRRKFDAAHTDPLLGGGGDAFGSVIFSTNFVGESVPAMGD